MMIFIVVIHYRSLLHVSTKIGRNLFFKYFKFIIFPRNGKDLSPLFPNLGKEKLGKHKSHNIAITRRSHATIRLSASVSNVGNGERTKGEDAVVVAVAVAVAMTAVEAHGREVSSVGRRVRHAICIHSGDD